MCVAVPGKIVQINGTLAKVDVMNNLCDVNIQLVTPQIGDYVLIHAGYALEVLKMDYAKELISIFQELEEAMDEDSSTSNR